MNTRHPSDELISALVDGRLDIQETHRMALHMRDCASCRATLAQFESNKALYRRLKPPAPPSEQFWTDTFRKMRAGDNARAGVGRNDSSPVGGRGLGRIWDARRLSAVFVGVACASLAIIVPLSHHDTVIPPSTVQPGTPIVEDAIDDIDVASFVRAHTESVANQPLSDPDRQQMISADVDAAPIDDQTAAPSGNADVSP